MPPHPLHVGGSDVSTSTSSMRCLLLLLLLDLGLGCHHHSATAFTFPTPVASTACRRLPLSMKSAPAPSIVDASHPDPKAGFRRLQNLPLPPGPRGLPFVGNMLRLMRFGGNFDQYDAWVQRRFGPVVLSNLLGAFLFRLIVVVPNPLDLLTHGPC